MKQIIILMMLLMLPFAGFAQMKWQPEDHHINIHHPVEVFGDVTIDKDACTITKDGKTYKLYGKIKIVDNWADLKVQIVENWPDLKVKIVENWPDKCGKFQVVDTWPELKVQIVDNFADIKVKVVENWPGF